MPSLSRLGKHLRVMTGKVGLEMQQFYAAPNLDDESGPHHAQAVFTLKPDFTPEPEKDDEWDKFEEEQAKTRQEEEEAKAREGLGDLLKNLKEDPSKGFL